MAESSARQSKDIGKNTQKLLNRTIEKVAVENLTNGITGERTAPKQFSSLDNQEVSRSSSQTSQKQTTSSSSSLRNNQHHNDDDNDDDSFSEQMIKMNPQEDVRRRQQQQELIRQQEQTTDRETIINDQAKQAVHHSSINDEEARIYNSEQDMSASFLGPQPLTSEFFASKKNAMAQSKDVVLYSVVATNPYDTTDDEELNLAPGQVIHVVAPSQDDEPLDDGWLIGFNTATGMRGLFPENFTWKL